MLVFISWSKPRSKQVALALRDWLPKVIQAVKPWVSDKDLASGVSWFQEVGNRLNEASIGIICVTPENHSEPWLMFEAGAIAKSVTANASGQPVHCCPYVLGMKLTDVTGPLAQLQARTADRDGTRALVQTINDALVSNSIENQALDEIFDTWWPKFENRLADVQKQDDKVTLPRRSERDILEEILSIVREGSRPMLNESLTTKDVDIISRTTDDILRQFQMTHKDLASTRFMIDHVLGVLEMNGVLQFNGRENHKFVQALVSDQVRRYVTESRRRELDAARQSAVGGPVEPGERLGDPEGAT